MNKHFLGIMVGALATLFISLVVCGGCQSEPVAPQLPVAVQQPVMPVMPTIAEPVAPPAPEPPPTPLTPIIEEAPAAKTGGGTGVCKRIPGVATPGDEVAGNYTCKFDVELPFGLKPPAFDCALRKQSEGNLTLGTSGGPSALRGNVTETKTGGFRLKGQWNYPGIKLNVDSCMMRKGASFQGSGVGVLNDDKTKKTKFKLTMTRK